VIDSPQAAGGILQRKADGSKTGAWSNSGVPPIVHEVLHSPGQPLDATTRAFMEPRFWHDFSRVMTHAGGCVSPPTPLKIGSAQSEFEQQAETVAQRTLSRSPGPFDGRQDFSSVRIHTDANAAKSAEAVAAHAFTAGNHIVFGTGQFAPGTNTGRRLLAHELAHVVQQSRIGPTVQRFSYAELKEQVYSGLIGGLRAAKKATLDLLRGQVGRLPKKWWGAANLIISIIDEVLGIIESLILGVIGMVTGFGEGVYGLVKGTITLGYGVLKLLYDLASGIFNGFDELKQDLGAVLNALKNLPSALSAMVKNWLAKFEKASLERQSLMIGELFGQIEALIASFAVASSRAGTAGTAAGSEGTTGAAGLGSAAETASAGTQATRPALTLIRGGGEAASTAPRAAATAFERNAALKLAPVVEEAPAVAPPLRLVPPPAAAPVAAPIAAKVTGTATKVAIGTGIGVSTVAGNVREPEDDKKRRGPIPIRWPVPLWHFETGVGDPGSKDSTFDKPESNLLVKRGSTFYDARRPEIGRYRARISDPPFNLKIPPAWPIHHKVPLYLGGHGDKERAEGEYNADGGILAPPNLAVMSPGAHAAWHKYLSTQPEGPAPGKGPSEKTPDGTIFEVVNIK
jgi:hypothetical protein